MPKTKPFDQYQEEYEYWFDAYEPVYISELEAIRQVFPSSGKGVEIGVGSGLFAAPLGVREGCDPSVPMLKRAEERGLKVVEGVAENLPYNDASFDYALMVTTICFVDDPQKSVDEVYRILRPGGRFILGFVDKNSPIGKVYLKHKAESTFYAEAEFFSTNDIYNLLEGSGFSIEKTVETVFGQPDEIKQLQEPRDGHGDGSFVVVVGQKN